MMNLFKKKQQEGPIVDKILMTQAAKWKVLSELWKNNNNIIFVFWFDETLRKAVSFFSNEGITLPDLLNAREVHSSLLAARQVIFAEHYPLSQKEKEFFEKLKLTEVQIWSAMDEPLFKEFGSEKIVQMMKQLGMKEFEVIENSMISKAIHNAQEKISKKVLIDQNCSSQEEWLRKNWNS